MKKLWLLFGFCFAVLFMRAQTFAVTDTVVYFSGSAQATDIVSGYAKIYNTSGDTLPLRWVRAQENIPGWWRSSVCTEYYCFAIPDDSATWNLLPGDSDLVYIHIYPYGNSGTGDVVVRLFDTRQPAAFTDIRFVVDVLASVPEQGTISFNSWPSPAADWLNVQLNTPREGQLQITDVAGRIVHTQAVSAADARLELNVARLETGLYSVIFESEQGERAVVKFVKQ
ncbi:MAG: T9SS type A sorting domain-containing protein [Bacteroidia bacterium]|jgi:hypothetical protein|nr:T9SS type A sorting domain-containing protein [Bacteroidia bacterium]